MKDLKKIAALWIAIVGSYALTLHLFPHVEVPAAVFAAYSTQTLLAIISFRLAVRDPVVKNKPVFLNFGLFFALGLPAHVSNFVGSAFLTDDRFAKIFFDQYVCYGLYLFLLAGSIVYLAFDVLFRNRTTLLKYGLTLLVAGGAFLFYFHPYLADPKHGYSTAEVMDWKILDRAYQAYEKKEGAPPSPEQLTALVTLPAREEGGAGLLSAEANEDRVFQIYPYLQGANYLILVWQPMMQITMMMALLCIGFILLFFGYQFLMDPPQGAYIDKIMFLLLIFCSLEIFHAWSAIKLLEWEVLATMLDVGQYLSIGVLFLVSVFFFLRLRFVTSARGEFYEQELAQDPEGITRWRDTLDNLVIERFFNRKAILGRMFVQSHDRRRKRSNETTHHTLQAGGVNQR